LLAALDAAVAVGEADADALLPAQDRPDIQRRARLDDLVARIAGEEFGALALEDFCNDLRAVHGVGPWLGEAKCRAAARGAGRPPAAAGAMLSFREDIAGGDDADQGHDRIGWRTGGTAAGGP